MKTLITARPQCVKASFAALLIALVHCHLMAEEDLSAQYVFSLSDDDLGVLSREVDHGCIFWLFRARSAHEFDKRKKYPSAPENQWYDFAQNSMSLTGDSMVATTSLDYILGEKMLKMAFSGIDPEFTGRTIYNECMKYEPEFSDTRGGHPHPRLRSPTRER